MLEETLGFIYGSTLIDGSNHFEKLFSERPSQPTNTSYARQTITYSSNTIMRYVAMIGKCIKSGTGASLIASLKVWCLENVSASHCFKISEDTILANADKTHTIDGCGHWIKEKTLLLQMQEVLVQTFWRDCRITQSIVLDELRKVLGSRKRVYESARKQGKGARPD